MDVLLKHYNIDRNLFYKILIVSSIIDIFQILFLLLIFSFINLILYIIIEIIIHYLILHYIVHICLFGGSCSLFTKYNCWRLGLEISRIFSEKLEDFKNSLKDFYSTSNNQKILTQNELYSKSSTLSSINELIYSYLKLSNTVDEKNISSFQKNIVVYLNRLKMTIEESHLSKIVSEATIRFNRHKKFEIKSEKLDKLLDKMIGDVDNVLEQIKQFQLKGNLWSNIINFLRNDSFGSLIQLKNDLLSHYYCESFKVNIGTSVKIDCLLIKNKEKTKKENRIMKKISGFKHIKEIKEEQIEKEEENNSSQNKEETKESTKEDNEEEKKVEEKDNINEDSINKNIIKDEGEKEQKSNQENDKKTAILICNKSVYPYELSAYYDKWIEYYLNWGITVVLYNYRGYGESTGFSTISNMQTDADEIIEYLKKKYFFTNIGVHGINLGGIPASYLCSLNKINFCFIDRTFGSLYEFIQDLTFINSKYILKSLFIKDCDMVQLLNASLKRRQNGKNVFKVISYDLKKEFINHNVSLRTKMAKDFYNKLTNNNGNNEYILKTILDEKEREYDCFENDIFYVIQKIINMQNETKDYRLELNSIMESINFNTNKNNNSLVNTSDLDSQISNIDTTSPFEKELHKEGENYQEKRIITSIQHIFEKFDAGGETLLTLYKTNENRKKILNDYFVNLLAWGSYKIGEKYATNLLVAYNAIIKKFPYANKRFEKILGNPKKYVINDGILTSSLKTVLDCLKKIQKFYEKNFLSHKNKNIEIIIDQDKSIYDDIDKTKNNNSLNLNDNSINELINEDNEKKKIIDLVNEINIGNLFILNCGNSGEFSREEIKMLSTFLVNSNFT